MCPRAVIVPTYPLSFVSCHVRFIIVTCYLQCLVPAKVKTCLAEQSQSFLVIGSFDASLSLDSNSFVKSRTKETLFSFFPALCGII